MTSSFTSSTTSSGCVYFNANLQNAIGANVTPIRAQFNQNMNVPIIENAKDYNLAITRFSVSTSDIPIFICLVQIGQPDYHLTPFIFTALSTSLGLSFDRTVSFNAQDSLAELPASPLIKQDFSTGYYNVYTIQFFVNLINNALRRLCEDLFTAGEPVPNPALDTLNSVFIQYNDSTTLFEIVAPVEYDLTAGGNKPRIYVNQALNLLLGLKLNYIGRYAAPNPNVDWLLIASQPFGGQTVTLAGDKVRVVTAGDHRGIDMWSPLSRILVTSSSLQTRGEFMQPNVNYGTLSIPSSNASTTNIITDFEPDFYNNPLIDRNFIQYSVTGIANYRLIEFGNIGQSEIRNFDIQFYWVDKYGNINPLYLRTGCGLSLKLCFAPKNMIEFN